MEHQLIRVGIVSLRLEISNMLQRYVGGILKGIAVVDIVRDIDHALRDEYDLYVVYTVGIVFKKLNTKIETERIVPVELFPMPMGIKRVMQIPEGSRLGVIAGHYWDATDLLGQLLHAGVRNYRFTTDSTSHAEEMDVDYYVVPEECIKDIQDKPQIMRNALVIPRSLAAQSISEIIKRVISVQRGDIPRANR